ncbi:unnamed protein product, partial [Fusarium equiseti]
QVQYGKPRTTGTRTEEQRQRDLRKIKKYRDLENEIRTKVATGTYDHDLLQLTAELLHLNPEYYTIWYVRRRCLTSSVLSKRPQDKEPYDQIEPHQESDTNALKSELSFTVPLLMGSPKCYWIWNFRQWILSQAILRFPMTFARGIWEEELRLTSLMLSKDQRNFHAWGYRRFLVAKLESAELQGKSMGKEEFKYTTKMIRSNLSNFSAWHNRSQLIPRLLQERGADPRVRATFLDEELSFVREGLDVGPEDQSLWYYHRFLISQIVGGGGQQTVAAPLDVDEKAVYVRRGIHEMKDLLDDYETSSASTRLC